MGPLQFCERRKFLRTYLLGYTCTSLSEFNCYQ